MPFATAYDVIIIGAGPAGATCALQLRHSGLRVLLVDKAQFPRDKICGDAVVGHSTKTLFSLCPEMRADFKHIPTKTLTNQTRLYVNSRQPFDINWVNEAYCCTRLHFDNFLFQSVQKYAPNVTVLENFTVDFVERMPPNGDSQPSTEGEGVVIGNKATGQYFKAKMLVGCDGAHSVVSKHLTTTKLDHRHHAGAVRAYFKGVGGIVPNRTEVFFLPQFSPGYFWVFPLSDGLINVGFGMLTQKISEKKVNLRQAFYEFIEASPILKPRFEGSEQIGKLAGFGLPFASRRVTMSGDHFLLAGDAASLIDPASGEGISNATVSGKKAGEMVIEAFNNQNFSASLLKAYDTHVFNIIGKELFWSSLLLNLSLKAPFLIDVGAYLMKNSSINRLVKKFL